MLTSQEEEMTAGPLTAESLKRRIDAAQGRIPCDWILKNARYLDVFHGCWREGDLSIFEGAIVGLEPGLKGKRERDLKGKSVVPGLIDAHVHLESSMMRPEAFDSMVLPKGTTTAICDPHELANVIGIGGIQYFLDAAPALRLDLRVMLSSCVPATSFETNGGGEILAKDLLPLKSHSHALGLAEMMNVPGVVNGDPLILEKLVAFQDRSLDGHCPLVRGRELSAYAAAGISSCHESSQLEEASEKLTKGLAVWIREGSVAKDLRALAPLLSMATSTGVGFCTDDRNPLDISTEGHLDFLVRGAIRLGVPAEVVYRSASWSVARHYGLDRGLNRLGAIAPGFRADLLVLGDVQDCGIESVMARGTFLEDFAPTGAQAPNDAGLRNTVRAVLPEARDLEGPSGRVHVIGVKPGKILTDHLVLKSDEAGVARISVLERYGKGSGPANAYVLGFGNSFHGAIASSVGHDSHNLIVVGTNTVDMRVALAALMKSGGGFSVVDQGQVLAHLELPIGGLMSDRSPDVLVTKLRALRDASRSVGCELEDPFLQLAFLSLPVIPALKLTDRGLFDVQNFKPISVAAQ